MHGPFLCGLTCDLRIFKLGMTHALLDGERVVADGGYRDIACEKNPKGREIWSGFHAMARARHETVNRRFKQFSVIGQRFRHELTLHSSCFHTVANLTHVIIQNGEPLFGVDCQ